MKTSEYINCTNNENSNNLNINDIIYIQLLRLFNHPIYEQDTYNYNNTIIFNNDYIIYNNK